MAVRDKIGVLDLQGGVLEHVYHLKALGIEAVRIKDKNQFTDIAGLIIPGGESTTLSKLMNIFGIDVAIKEAFADGMKIWGTCAGAILLSSNVENESPKLGLMDITIARNAFGFQIDSFRTKVKVAKVTDEEIDLTFIRAPKIISTGKDVDVLLRIDDYIAAAESSSCIATVFHPELTPSLAFHKYFVKKCGLTPSTSATQRVSSKGWMELARITKPHK